MRFRNSNLIPTMKIRYLVLFLVFTLQGFSIQKKHYDLKAAPIDVVIPCHPKDLDTLELCIEGIRKYGQNIRRVIVVFIQKTDAECGMV